MTLIKTDSFKSVIRFEKNIRRSNMWMEAVGYFDKQSRFANKMKSKYYQLKKFADDFEK